MSSEKDYGSGKVCTPGGTTKYPAEGAKVTKNGGNTPLQACRPTSGPATKKK